MIPVNDARDLEISEVTAQSYIKGLRDGRDIGYQQGRVDAIDALISALDELKFSDGEINLVFMGDVRREAQKILKGNE